MSQKLSTKQSKKLQNNKIFSSKPSKIFQAISFLGIGFGTAISVQAAPCTASGSTISTVNDCEITDSNLTQISIKDGAKVLHDLSGGNLVINNAATTNADSRFTGWSGHGTYGIRIAGANSSYQINSASSMGDVTIDVGTSGANVRGRGVSAEAGSEVTIYANKLNISTIGNYTNDWNANNALYTDGGSTLNIFADELNLLTTKATTPYGTIASVGGTVNIKGNNGLSVANLTNTGDSSAGLWASSENVNNQANINLELININASAASNSNNYTMGIYANGPYAAVTFIAGTINATNSRAGTGIRTFNRSNVIAKGYEGLSLAITTDGLDSRGIRATGQSAVVINSDQKSSFKTVIETTGGISDGLNAGRLGAIASNGTIVGHGGEPGSQYAGSNIAIYGETHISTTAATSYGLRAIGDGARISILGLSGQNRSSVYSKGTAVRFDYGNGYSTNVDGTSARDQQQIMTLEKVDLTHGGSSGSFALTNTGTLCNISASLCDTNGNNTWSTGHLIQVGNHDGDAGRGVNDGRNAMTVANAVKNGVLNLDNSTAAAIDGKDLLNVTYGGGTNLVADKVSSSFTLNAKNNTILKGSIFTDLTLDKDGVASSTDLNMAGNSQWYIARDSNLTKLDIQNSQVFLNHYDSWKDTAGNWINNAPQPTTYHTVSTNKLSGSNSTFYFNTDIVGQQTDLLKVIDVSGTSGSHYAQVKNDGSQSTTGTERIDIIETNGGTASFNLRNVVELGAWEYGLRANPNSPNNWELYSLGRANKPTQSAYSLLNTNYLLGYIDVQTLLQRMGELRQTDSQDKDVWVRATSGKLDSFGGSLFDGYSMDYSGVQGGVDTRLTLDSGKLYLGGMVGYTTADHDFSSGDGTAKSYHMGLYGTYLTDSGFYVDGILKYTHLKNDYSVQDSQDNLVKGSGKSDGYSLSLEAGKRFYVSESVSGRTYLEPQAQITYTYQEGFSDTANNNLHVDFDSYNSTLLRGSVIVGYEIKDLANPVNVYLKTGYVQELTADAGSRVNGIGMRDQSFKGGWWDNGIGVTTQINKKHNLYLDGNYATGNKFDQMQINAGYRYSF